MSLRVIQVGVGGFGNCWTSVILESNEVSLVGFVDVKAEILKEQASKYSISPEICFAGLDRAIEEVQADAVVNVTPPVFHKAVNFGAFEAELHVLSEKPLSDNYKDCLDIVRKARQKDVVFMVSQDYRYQNNIQTIRKLILSGRYGKPGYAIVDFFIGPHFGGFREQMDYPLIIDMAIHHFDLMRYLLDKDPLCIYARSWNPSWSWFKGDAASSVLIEMTDGVHVTYNASWVATGAETTWNGNWRIECEKGVILLKDDRVLVGKKSGHLKEVPPLKMSRQRQGYSLHEFVTAIKEGREPDSGGEDNLKSINMVFQTIEAIKGDKRVVTAQQPTPALRFGVIHESNWGADLSGSPHIG